MALMSVRVSSPKTTPLQECHSIVLILPCSGTEHIFCGAAQTTNINSADHYIHRSVPLSPNPARIDSSTVTAVVEYTVVDSSCKLQVALSPNASNERVHAIT